MLYVSDEFTRIPRVLSFEVKATAIYVKLGLKGSFRKRSNHEQPNIIGSCQADTNQSVQYDDDGVCS